jgi:hypothetical protein
MMTRRARTPRLAISLSRRLSGERIGMQRPWAASFLSLTEPLGLVVVEPAWAAPLTCAFFIDKHSQERMLRLRSGARFFEPWGTPRARRG